MSEPKYTAFSFDATNIEPQRPRGEVIPKGKYSAIITDSDVAKTKAGGKRLNLQFEVIDGPHKGAVFFDGLNVENSNPQAEEIARRALAAICVAVGVFKIGDTQELHNKPLLVHVGVEEPRENKDRPGEMYPQRNSVNGYEPIGGTKPGVAGLQAVAPTTAPAATPTPRAPRAPAKPKEDKRVFWVAAGPEDVRKLTAKDIGDMLAAGMPAETPVMVDGEAAWQTSAHYEIVATVAAPVAPTPPPAPVAPPIPPKPVAPAAPAAPAANSAISPWLRPKTA